MTFDEILKSTKEKLEGMLTADNTETITSIVSQLDDLDKVNKTNVQEIADLKDRIVSYVKNTQFKEPPKDSIDDKPKTFEEISAENLEKIKEARKQK